MAIETTGLIGNRKMQRSELRVITCLLLTEIQRHGCDGGAMGIGVAETVVDLDSDINTLCILSSSSYTYFYSTLFFLLLLYFFNFAQR